MNSEKDKVKTRTEYSATNITVATISRVAAILLGFFSRVVLTQVLSVDYVGINGLFLEIINILSLSELGVGSAITYALYKPVARNDIEKQKSLIRVFRNIYFIIAGIVCALGLVLIPFLGIIMKNKPNVENLTLLYLLYLCNAVVSYFMVYKRTLIDAHQLGYIGTLYQTSLWTAQSLVQMIVLYFTRNFALYLSVMIVASLVNNILISRKADKLYPFLKDKDVKPLPKHEKREIVKNIKAMLMHKVGNVVITSSDNLMLSSIVGIIATGMYSNYYLVIGSIRQILSEVFKSVTASVGNLGVRENRDRFKKIFEAMFFMGQWMFGFCAICLYECLDPFVAQNFGEGYVFTRDVTLILCINFYATGMRQATLVFRDSMGLFKYDRYKAIPEAIINIAASIILGRKLGTTGIFIGTLVSTVLTSFWVEPYVLYKKALNRSPVIYFAKYGVYALITAGLWLLSDYLCNLVSGGYWRVCLLRLCICIVVVNVGYLAAYFWTPEFKLLLQKGLRLIETKLARFGIGGRKAKGKAAEDRATDDKATEGKAAEDKATEDRAAESKAAVKEITATESAVGENPADTGGLKEAIPDVLAGEASGKALAAFLTLVGNSLNKEKKDVSHVLDGMESHEIGEVVQLAEYHEVLPFLFDYSDNILNYHSHTIEVHSVRAVMQSYRMTALTGYIIRVLSEAGIDTILLKGCGIAAYYPVPEYRTFGDVDILLKEPARIEEACEILAAHKCVKKANQDANHHVEMLYDGKYVIELHTTVVEDFDNRRVNRMLRNILKAKGGKSYVPCRCEYMEGVSFDSLQPEDNAFALLLHMLQHFLRSGFGFRLICDWNVFWQQELNDGQKEEYLDMVTECGIKYFSDIVTSICVDYLGLPLSCVAWMDLPEKNSDFVELESDFLAEILKCDRFGMTDTERTVVLRDDSIISYVREFHHQTCLNYPKASKVFIIWPALWILSFIRFIRNNKDIRKVSTTEVLKNAGKRGKLASELHIWQ